ncbi:hypothetical protein BU15DRAFT_81765 [Melanogaster broomeanus]|nr:hypothetical protein BU15DRAFT_81765 [Melanogaster broomeanus]
MDPRTVLSSSVTATRLVQIAADVSNALRRYMAAMRGAESSYLALIDRIMLISMATQAAQSVLETSHSLEFGTKEQKALHTEWFRSDGSPVRCEKALEGFLSWLLSQAGGKQVTSGIKRLIIQKRVRAAIQTIEGHMPYFREMLSIDTASWAREIYTGLESEHGHTRNDAAAARREFPRCDAAVQRLGRAFYRPEELLEWLDTVDCTVKHETTREVCQITTGDWLLNEKLYNDWRRMSIRFLWLGGKAGAGKTVLASTVIDNVSSALADDETLAYFYCDFRSPRSTRTTEILRSLTVQLLINSKIDWLSSEPLSELLTLREQGAGPPVDLGTLSDLLRRTVRLHQRPIIVIDALDECDDLSELLDELVKLDADGHCRVFVTARPLHSINGALAGLPSISLDDRTYAVRNDMYFHINTELESRARLKTLHQDQKEEIRVTLMDKANGMFRWVQCQLDRLNTCWTADGLRYVLDTLPETLCKTYERMLSAIDKNEFSGRITRRALTWIVTARRPLKLSQLTEALAIYCDKPVQGSPTAIMHKTDILEICGSLVSYHEETGIITLSHYSVKEYLTSDDIADKTFFVYHSRANLEIASVLIYSMMLSTDEQSVGLSDSRGSPWRTSYREDELPTHTLSHYATYNGFYHLGNCVPEDNDRLLRLLLTFQNHVSNHRRIYATRMDEKSWMTKISHLALYIVIRFGHVSMLRHYLGHYSVQVTKGANPLVYAALYGDVPRVQTLLDYGLDVNVEAIVPGYYCDQNMLPLIAATFNRDQEVLTLLARRTPFPRDAIHSVLQVSRVPSVPRTHVFPEPSLIRILLQHGADVMLSVAGGATCLHLLLKHWFTRRSNMLEIARLLVEAGGDPAALNDKGLSPFHLAITHGVLEFVQWLIENGFRPPPDAILHAARCRPEDLTTMFHVLLECDVAVDIEDDYGNNALHLLARCYGEYNKTVEVASKLLLEKGCDIDCRNHQGKTPLHLAAMQCELPYVQFLIDQGAQLPHDIINHVCWGAVGYDYRPVMTLLVYLVRGHGASCQARTAHGDNALHVLLWQEQFQPLAIEPMAEFLFLVENGCDFHATNSSGITVVGTAIEHGYNAIARSLISRLAQPGAHRDMQPDLGDFKGDTILHRLCHRLPSRWKSVDEKEHIWMKKVELLQEAGFDLTRNVNTPNNQGFSPLCIVLQGWRCHPAIVSRLLHLGAKFSDVNPFFLDNVEWASDLPWYRDATEAYECALAKPTITFSDVVRVHYLLANHCSSKLPVPIVRLIMDMAEYWACTRVLRENIQCTKLDDSHEPIAFPVVSPCWMPCKVMFSCKQSASDMGMHQSMYRHLPENSTTTIELLMRRQNKRYNVPVELNVTNSQGPPRTAFGVWHGYTTAEQLKEGRQLRVQDLTSGDMLNLGLHSYGEFIDAIELDFFQIDTYFMMRPRHDDP